MCTRHVVPSRRNINKLNCLRPVRVPLRALVHGVLLCSLLNYVALSASRCRRFIGDTHGSRVLVSVTMDILRSDYVIPPIPCLGDTIARELVAVVVVREGGRADEGRGVGAGVAGG
jgi:hypothetical protein